MITNKALTGLSIVCFLAGSALALFAANDFLIFAQILFAMTLVLTVALILQGIIRTLETDDTDTKTYVKKHLLDLFSPLIVLCLQLILLLARDLFTSSVLSALYIASLCYVSFMGNRT